MLGQLGFALPLMIFMGLEAVIGSLLLLPKPFNQPAILLARGAHHQVGRTIFYTLIGFFALLLVSPLYDAIQIFNITKAPSDPTTPLDTTEHESRTLLQFTLTIACLAMLVFCRKLGDALDQLDRMSVSEAALLKQAKGLQSEYARALGDEATSADAATADNIAAPPASPAVDSGMTAGANAAGMGTNATSGFEAEREVPDLRQRVGNVDMDVGLNEPIVMDAAPVGVAAKKEI